MADDLILRIGATLDDLDKAFAQIPAKTKKLNDDLSKSQKETVRGQRDIISGLADMARRAVSVETAVGHMASRFLSFVAIEETIRRSYLAFTELDEQLRRVGIGAGRSLDSVKAMLPAFQELASRTGMSVNQIVGAFDTLRESGRLSLEQTRTAFSSVASAAHAMGADMQDVSKTAGAFIRSFGVDVKDVGLAMDILVKGQQQYNVDVRELVRWGPQLVSLMQDWGYKGTEGITRMVAYLGSVNKAFGNTQLATRALMELFSSMDLKAVGDRVGRSSERMIRDLRAVADAGGDVLSVFTGWVVEAQRAGLDLAMLPPVMRKAMIPLLSDMQQMPGITANLRNSIGATKKALEELDKGPNEAIHRLLGELEGLKTSFGEMLNILGGGQMLDQVVNSIHEIRATMDLIKEVVTDISKMPVISQLVSIGKFAGTMSALFGPSALLASYHAMKGTITPEEEQKFIDAVRTFSEVAAENLKQQTDEWRAQAEAARKAEEERARQAGEKPNVGWFDRFIGSMIPDWRKRAEELQQHRPVAPPPPRTGYQPGTVSGLHPDITGQSNWIGPRQYRGSARPSEDGGTTVLPKGDFGGRGGGFDPGRFGPRSLFQRQSYRSEGPYWPAGLVKASYTPADRETVQSLREMERTDDLQLDEQRAMQSTLDDIRNILRDAFPGAGGGAGGYGGGGGGGTGAGGGGGGGGGPTAGPTRADRNNNPGNIKFGAFAKAHGATGADSGGFAIFPNREAGYKAAEALLGGSGYQGLTLRQIGAKWAAGDPGWAQRVSAATGIPLDAVPTESQRRQIVRGGGLEAAEGSMYAPGGTLAGVSRENAPNVFESQRGAKRFGAISEQERAVLQAAAEAAGVNVNVTSGGEVPGGWHSGSGRHVAGNAADFDLIDPKTKQRIPINDPRALAFAYNAGLYGGTSGGAAPGYMGSYKMDIGVGPRGRGAYTRGPWAQAFNAGRAERQRRIAAGQAPERPQVARRPAAPQQGPILPGGADTESIMYQPGGNTEQTHTIKVRYERDPGAYPARQSTFKHEAEAVMRNAWWGDYNRIPV